MWTRLTFLILRRTAGTLLSNCYAGLRQSVGFQHRHSWRLPFGQTSMTLRGERSDHY